MKSAKIDDLSFISRAKLYHSLRLIRNIGIGLLTFSGVTDADFKIE